MVHLDNEMEVKLGLWLFHWSQLTMQPSNQKNQFELILKQPLISFLHLNMYKLLKELTIHLILKMSLKKP